METTTSGAFECHFYRPTQGAVVSKLQGAVDPFADLAIFSFYAFRQLGNLRLVWGNRPGSTAFELAEGLASGLGPLTQGTVFKPPGGIVLVSYQGVPASKQIVVKVTLTNYRTALSVHPKGFGLAAKFAPVSSRETATQATASVLLLLVYLSIKHSGEPIVNRALGKIAAGCALAFEQGLTDIQHDGPIAISLAASAILHELALSLGLPTNKLAQFTNAPYETLVPLVAGLLRFAAMPPDKRVEEMTALADLIRRFGPQ